MTRRALLFAVPAAAMAAEDPARAVWNVLTGMASALTEDDTVAFLSAIDPSMPGFDRFRLAVSGLLNEVSIDSSISPIENSGDAGNRTMVVDWSMRLVDNNELDLITSREANVTMKFVRRRGKWKVVSFEPDDFFRAPERGGLPPSPKA